MISLLRLFFCNAYLGLMMLLLVSIIITLVGLVGVIFKIDPVWFAIVGGGIAVPTAIVTLLIEAIVARARRNARMV